MMERMPVAKAASHTLMHMSLCRAVRLVVRAEEAVKVSFRARSITFDANERVQSRHQASCVSLYSNEVTGCNIINAHA